MKKKCLVVDDDKATTELMLHMLRKYFDCDSALSGQHAWELIDAKWQAGTPYDLICCDLTMPGLDGRELIKKVRALEESTAAIGGKRTRIFVVSASNSTRDIVDTFMNGVADGYILKPFRLAQLYRLLSENGFEVDPAKVSSIKLFA